MADLAPSRDSVFRPGDHLPGLNAMSRGTAMEPLGIVFTEIGPDFLRATMPVDARTKQPYGLLHGGASVLLAETLGSSAGMLCVREGEGASASKSTPTICAAFATALVTGTARPLHVGRQTQVWEIRIEDDRGKLVCVSRLTLAVIPLARRGETHAVNASHTLRFALRTPLLLWHVLVDLPLTMLLIAHAVAPASTCAASRSTIA